MNQILFKICNFTELSAHCPKKFILTTILFLFVGKFQINDDNLRGLDTKAITRVYKRLAVKARKNTPCNDWGLIRSHNLRKYFNSILLNAGTDSFFTEFLMGHTLDDTRFAYFGASPEKLKEVYLKFVPYLTTGSPSFID